MATPIADYPKTGIRIVIVGAGFGGLATAIECTLKGHDVVVLEKAPTWTQLGDIISISPNAGQVLSRWDRTKIFDRLHRICMHHKIFRIHTHTGEWVLDQPKVPPSDTKPMYNGHRAEIHQVIYEYALSLGIPILLGKRIEEYHEDPSAGTAWVKTDSGEVFMGDVVVGADGVRSRARKLVLGYDDKPVYSGYAIYRAWFNVEAAGIDKDPLTREFVMNGDTHTGWLGPDVHLLVATCKGGKELSWVCTHKDDADVEESWSSEGRIEDVLKLLEAWDPRCHAIVHRTPKVLDWKLVHRDPLPTWVTENGLTCVLGDAAHPFLPTSVQGCSQAIEDGVALATCLSMSKHDPAVAPAEVVPTALRIYQRLRMERVLAAQKKGEEIRNKWHKADWSKVRENPELVKLPRDEWLIRHDSERWIRKMWAPALSEHRGGSPLPRCSLAAGPDTNEFDVQVELPPTPVGTPKEELDCRLGH